MSAEDPLMVNLDRAANGCAVYGLICLVGIPVASAVAGAFGGSLPAKITRLGPDSNDASVTSSGIPQPTMRLTSDCVRIGPTYPNLSQAAAHWGLPYTTVAVANKIPNPDLVYGGQEICKPEFTQPSGQAGAAEISQSIPAAVGAPELAGQVAEEVEATPAYVAPDKGYNECRELSKRDVKNADIRQIASKLGTWDYGTVALQNGLKIANEGFKVTNMPEKGTVVCYTLPPPQR